MMVVWFVLGVLCGGGVCLCLQRVRCRADVEKSEPKPGDLTKEWGETRNFLYYDGTEMPVIKEET